MDGMVSLLEIPDYRLLVSVPLCHRMEQRVQRVWSLGQEVVKRGSVVID